MDDLLETYHTELRKTLKMLGCSDVEFTIEHLKKEFEDRAYFGLITACFPLSIILADPEEITDLENVTLDDLKAAEGNPMKKSFSGTLYRETFQKLLLYFESKGIL
jgi:pyoverdine/dityrosine biosynthesis protein Dit1